MKKMLIPGLLFLLTFAFAETATAQYHPAKRVVHRKVMMTPAYRVSAPVYANRIAHRADLRQAYMEGYRDAATRGKGMKKGHFKNRKAKHLYRHQNHKRNHRNFR